MTFPSNSFTFLLQQSSSSANNRVPANKTCRERSAHPYWQPLNGEVMLAWAWCVCYCFWGALGQKAEPEGPHYETVEAEQDRFGNLQCRFQIPRPMAIQAWTIRWLKEETSAEWAVTFDPFERQFVQAGRVLVSVTVQESNNSLAVSDLWINPIQVSDAGTYSCRLAMNERVDGGDQEQSHQILGQFQLHVRGLGASPSTRSDVEVVEGSLGHEVILTCPIVGDPAPRISWALDAPPFDIDGTTLGYAITPNGSSLTIASLEETRMGKYRCEAENPYGVAAQEFQVTLGGEEQREQTTFDQSIDLVVIKGQYVILECPQAPKNGTAGSISTQWWRLGDSQPLVQDDPSRLAPSVQKRYADRIHRLEPLHGYPEGSIILKNVFSLDSGSYHCQVTDHLGGSLPGLVSSLYHVKVRPKLSFASLSPDLVVVSSAKEPLELHCRVRDTRDVQVQWFHDNCPLSNGSRVSLHGFQLQIQPVQISDAGLYRCELQGQNPPWTHDQSIQVQVVAPEGFLEVPTDQEVKEGDFLELACHPKEVKTLDGQYVLPRVTWFRDDRPLETQAFGRVTLSRNGNRLIFRTIERSDNGTYQCRASTGFDSESMVTFALQVLYPPRVSPLQPKAQFLIKDQPGRLVCHVDANPPDFSVSWYKNGQSIFAPPSNHIFYQTQEHRQDILNWNMVIEDDEGFYQCEVRGPNGSTPHSSEMFQVQLVDAPYFVQNPSTHYHVERFADLHVPCRAMGIPKPLISLVGASQDSVQVTEAGITLVNASAQTSGSYACIADNGVMRIHANFSIIVRQVPPPRPKIIQAVFNASSKHSVRVVWKSQLSSDSVCDGKPHTAAFRFLDGSAEETAEKEAQYDRVSNAGVGVFVTTLSPPDPQRVHAIQVRERNAFGWSEASEAYRIKIWKARPEPKPERPKPVAPRDPLILKELLNSQEVQKFIAFLAQEIVQMEHR